MSETTKNETPASQITYVKVRNKEELEAFADRAAKLGSEAIAAEGERRGKLAMSQDQPTTKP